MITPFYRRRHASDRMRVDHSPRSLRVEPLEQRCMLSAGHSDAGHSVGPPTIEEGDSQTVIGPHDTGAAGDVENGHFFAKTGDAHHFAWQDQDLSTPNVTEMYYDFRPLGRGKVNKNKITDTQKELAVLAFQKWEDATLGRIKFTQNTTISLANIINVGTGDLAALGFRSEPGGILGLGGGIYTHNADHTITRGIAWMDFKENWNETLGSHDPANGEFNYFAVVAQEVGHALGLGHLDDVVGANIMNGKYTGASAISDYSTADADHIQAVYGVGGPVDPVDEAPTVGITSPTDGATFESGVSVEFVGMASDAEDDDETLTSSIVWTSNINGQIGIGGSFSTTLSDGNHTITASVTDSGNNTAIQSVSIHVGDAPAEATSVSVASVSYDTEGGKNGDKNLLVTVAILDNLGSPPSGASISIDLFRDGSLIGRGTGTTGTDGTVTWKLRNAPRGTYTSVVTNVTADGLTWNGSTPTNGFTKSTGKSKGAPAELAANASQHVALPAAELEHLVEGMNWIDPKLPKGHNKHDDHVTWDTNPTSNGLITVKVLVDDHGNLNADKRARFYAAIAEVNNAAVDFGVDLKLVKVTDPNEFHNIHLHEDSNSGCGGTALGCAEFSIFIKNTGTFSDGHQNHLYAGEETPGGKSEATVLSGFNWYTGSEPGDILATQFDYQTVATQELLHLVGLDHDDTVYDGDDETVGNTDRRSVMHGSLDLGIVRRFMSTHDQELLGHLYGPGQADGGGGGGGGGGGKGKGPRGGGGPPGRNRLATSGLYAEVIGAADFGALPATVERSADADINYSPLFSEEAQPVQRAGQFEDRAALAESNELYRARHARRDAADQRLEAIESVFELWSGGLL